MTAVLLESSALAVIDIVAMPKPAVRFREHINGREFRIEVSNVDPSRWRAQVLNTHGGPSATMPFYGPTPESAARQLAAWLARAYGIPATS